MWFITDDWNQMIYSQLLKEYLKYDILIESVTKDSIQINESHNTTKSLWHYIAKLRRLGVPKIICYFTHGYC